MSIRNSIISDIKIQIQTSSTAFSFTFCFRTGPTGLA
jgi:hypothetical protein